MKELNTIKKMMNICCCYIGCLQLKVVAVSIQV